MCVTGFWISWDQRKGDGGEKKDAKKSRYRPPEILWLPASKTHRRLCTLVNK